jgi:hypothetical protein
VPRSDQLARVGASPERWTTFRQAALAQGVSVAAYLGRLVEAELTRREGRKVAGLSLAAPEPDQALAALAEVRASIDEAARTAITAEPRPSDEVPADVSK